MEQELLERVKVRIKEHEKRAKVLIEEEMNRRKKQEVKDVDDFIAFFNVAINEIQKGISFMEKLEEQPSMVFTDIRKYLQSRKGASISILNHWKKHEMDVNVHDLQGLLAHYANLHFQNWLKENEIDEPFYISIRNPRTYPSIFSVYHQHIELLQFNVFESWYGIRKEPLTEEEIHSRHNNDLERIENEIKAQEEKIEKEKDRKNHPLKHYKGLKNFFVYLFINKKKLNEAFDQLIKKEISILEHLKEEKIMKELMLESEIQDHKQRRYWLSLIEPFFYELNYSFQSNRNILY